MGHPNMSDHTILWGEYTTDKGHAMADSDGLFIGTLWAKYSGTRTSQQWATFPVRQQQRRDVKNDSKIDRGIPNPDSGMIAKACGGVTLGLFA